MKLSVTLLHTIPVKRAWKWIFFKRQLSRNQWHLLMRTSWLWVNEDKLCNMQMLRPFRDLSLFELIIINVACIFLSNNYLEFSVFDSGMHIHQARQKTNAYFFFFAETWLGGDRTLTHNDCQRSFCWCFILLPESKMFFLGRNKSLFVQLGC